LAAVRCHPRNQRWSARAEIRAQSACMGVERDVSPRFAISCRLPAPRRRRPLSAGPHERRGVYPRRVSRYS
jgi:hypothetical protein